MSHTAESLQQAFRYLFASEVKVLKELARSLPDNPTAINIGAGAGTSTLALLEGNPYLHLISIDIQYPNSPFGCIEAEMNIIKDSGYINRYAWLVGDSKEVGLAWQEKYTTGKVDMVFIDGDHSYKGCKGDILAWLPNLKPGGIMAVHDYNKKYVFREGPVENAPHPLPWPRIGVIAQ